MFGRNRSRNRARGGVGAGSVAPPFAPTDIAGLQLWLDASDAATITQAAGAVSQWNDKSGNLRHATQATGANQPTTGITTINGKNTISFDGNDFFGLSNSISQSTSFYYAIVFKCVAGVSLQAFFGGTSSGSPVYRINQSELTQMVRRAVAVVMTGTTALADNTNYILSAISKTTLSRNYVNGVVDGGEVTTNPSYSAPIDQIGAENSANFMTSQIGEILIYNLEPSDADKNRIGSYLSNKWGITWTNI